MKIAQFDAVYSQQLVNSATLGSPTSGDTSGTLPGPITVTGINGVPVDTPDGIATDYLNGQGHWTVPAGAGTYVTVTLGGKETYQTIAALGATHTLDLVNGNGFDATLTANCTLTFAGATAATMCSFMLLLRQDGTGGWTTTWPGSVIWAGGSAPTLDTTASTAAVLTFFTLDGGTTWYGFPTGASGSVSPLTTKGDLYTYSTIDARLGVGTDGQVLTASSAATTGLAWAAAGGQHILLADGHATPFAFTDLLQMDDGSDFMWTDS